MAKKISPEEQTALLATLEARFSQNKKRHAHVEWKDVLAKLEKDTGKLWSLHEMERTGGEPDLVLLDKHSNDYVFCDCSPESPIGRRSTCYDLAGLESRKEHRPAHNAVDMAAEMGIEMLSEEEYRALQQSGKFDVKTSSWIKTPEDIREKGGALFCDFRYGHVFVYHNGAQSYYGARGFRGKLVL